MKAKRVLSLLLAMVMLFVTVPITASAYGDVVLPEGMTADTALEVEPTDSGTFAFEGFETYNQDLWMKVTLTKRGILMLKCNKLANSAGAIDDSYFYVFKNADVATAIKKGESVSTSVAIWKDNYWTYESVPGDYKFSIPLNKGTYYIFIDTGISYGEYRDLEWSLKFTSTSVYEIEPNNGTNTATAMSLNKTINGYTDTSSDYYALTLTKNTPIRLYIGSYATLKENNVGIYITSPDGKRQYVSTYDVAKNSSGYYYDILLKKGINVIEVSSCTPAVKYSLKASTTISYAAPSISKIEKTTYTNYFDAKISWEEMTGIDGYQVQQKIGTGSWKTVYTASEYATGVSLYSLKKTVSYQFRVRAYKEFGSTKYYGSWSETLYVIPTPTNIKLSATSYTYNGKVKTPSLTIKDVNGTTLKKGTDYTVTYASGRKNVGTYKVTITFKGKYSGKVTKTFKINPAKTTVSKLTAGTKKLTVAITKKTTQVTGYQIQYSTSKSFSSYKTKTLTSYKTTSATLTGLKAKTTYYVRVRTYKTVNGVKYYSGWSTIKYKKTK